MKNLIKQYWGEGQIRRVVITGLGIIAPNGIGKDEFWQALISGKSGIDKITSFDASNLPCQIAGEEIKNNGRCRSAIGLYGTIARRLLKFWATVDTTRKVGRIESPWWISFGHKIIRHYIRTSPEEIFYKS